MAKKSSDGVRGAASSTLMGNKPKVAYANADAAKTNIVNKIRALKSALEESTVERSSLPHTPRQFNAWTSSKLPVNFGYVEPFGTNAQATLKKHPELFVSLDQLLQLIKSATESTKKKPRDRSEVVARLKSDIRLHLVIRQIAERELVMERRQTIRSNAKYEGLQSKMRSLEKESQSRISGLTEAVAQLEREKAVLIAAARKITPLRGVNNGKV